MASVSVMTAHIVLGYGVKVGSSLAASASDTVSCCMSSLCARGPNRKCKLRLKNRMKMLNSTLLSAQPPQIRSCNLCSGIYLGQHFHTCPFLWPYLFLFHWQLREGSSSRGFKPPLQHIGLIQEQMCVTWAGLSLDLPLGTGTRASLLLGLSRASVTHPLLPQPTPDAGTSPFELQFCPENTGSMNCTWPEGRIFVVILS